MSSFLWHLWWESWSILVVKGYFKSWNVGRHELCLCPMSSDMPILEGLLWAPVQLNFFICFNRLQCFLAIILCVQVVVIKVIKNFKTPSKVTKYLFSQKETLVSLCFIIQWDIFLALCLGLVEYLWPWKHKHCLGVFWYSYPSVNSLLSFK